MNTETLGDRFTVSVATYPQNYIPSLPRIQKFLNHWKFFWNVSIIIFKPSLKRVRIETSEILCCPSDGYKSVYDSAVGNTCGLSVGY
jgi:hypothetical protein